MVTVSRLALHEQIAKALRRELRTKYKPGSRLPAESELAKRFEVSIVTVREAMLQLSQEGLIERRHGSGTYVLETPPQTTVALVVSEAILRGQATYFFHYLSRRLQELLSANGIGTRFYLGQFEGGTQSSPETAQVLKKDVETGRVHAAVHICAIPPPEWCRFLEEHDVPVIGEGEGSAYGVGNDCEGMVREAVRLLARSGRRRVAFMQRPVQRESEITNGQFLAPFVEEMARQGLLVRKDWVFGSISPVKVGSDWERFRRLWLEGVERPDGVLIVDDHLYCDAAPAIMALGVRIPAELLVVTHANRGSDICYPFPTLRMEFDPEAHAQVMVEMLRRLLAGQKVERPHVLVPFTWVGMETLECALRVP